ncbi:unnamed protein product [Ixodes persulcatus]|uniref:Uncharacterized protein n=1 Tax=Ixodes scapularis TaxID=6945 RepID=B7QKZ5_IXOSC|nr:hypothetical protein IscW_ISCW013943 [Ixodes scapularis]|eukprot:XP_002415850.1 hypothetical protein IscW_ISCW013943 [Ixodes scapularis]
MCPQSSGLLCVALAVGLMALPVGVLSRKGSKKTYYYVKPEYRDDWYYPWKDGLNRRSYSSWEEPYDDWLPWKGYNYKSLLSHKHHHLHHGFHGHGRSGCGIELAVIGVLLIMPLVLLLGLMLPLVLITITLMLGLPMLIPAIPAPLPPLAAELGNQGRRRRASGAGVPEEEFLSTALRMFLVALAKYGDL